MTVADLEARGFSAERYRKACETFLNYPSWPTEEEHVITHPIEFITEEEEEAGVLEEVFEELRRDYGVPVIPPDTWLYG